MSKFDDRLTSRKIDGLRVLAGQTEPITAARFAMLFWPGKTFARGMGGYGLGPDASGRLGGRMLTSLERMGLAKDLGAYEGTAWIITSEGYRVMGKTWEA